MSSYSNSKALAPTFGADKERTNFVYFATLSLLGTALLAISSKISVPFWPVPATLQTLALFTIATVYGRNLAIATLLLYLAEGAMGLPVFAKGGGLAYFAGPTAGYLAGFVIAAGIVGYAADRGYDRNSFRLFGFMLIGEAVILGSGAAWLAILFGMEKGFAYGVGPFIVTDFIKIAIASLIVPAVWRLMRRGDSERKSNGNP